MNCTSVYQDDENEFVIIILQIKIILLLTYQSHLNLIDKGYHKNVSMDIELIALECQ